MTNNVRAQALVAIGGLGGSGTRLFAATVQAAGIDLGEAINPPMDNLWFTALFKRSEWARSPPDDAAVAKAADLFFRAMTCGLRDSLSADERALLLRLRADLLPGGRWVCGAVAADIDSLIDSGPRPAAQTRHWGWKEPNTHVFLRQLAAAFPRLRYVHVVRDGLDMAFSKNTWQTRNWSRLFGLTYGADEAMPVRQLRFWIAANRAALETGASQMPGRFLVISYEDYCARPDLHWPRLRDFLGLPASTAVPEALVRPTSIGRKQKHDLADFPPDLLAAAEALRSDLVKVGAST